MIRNGIEEIGEYAFYYNKKNSQYTVPSSVRKIGLGAFGDTGANSIVFQGDMPEIGEYAFAHDDITVYYPAGNNTWNTENSYNASSIEWVPYNTESIDIDNCTVTLDKSKYRRTGEEVKPKVTVQTGTETLKQGTDYSVRYSNNWGIGKGRIIITGKGRFLGAKTVYFDIIPRLKFYFEDAVCVPKDDTESFYFIPDDEVEQNLTYEIEDPSIAEVINEDSWQDDQMLKLKGLKVGTTRLTLNDGLGDPAVCVVEVEDWGSGDDPEISIYDVITHASVKNVIYNGKYQKPALNLQFRSGKSLVEGRDYEVEYTDNKNVGTADVWIYGIGDYYDVMLLEFNINPQGTTIKKVKKGKKAAKVKWNTQTAKMSKSHITGYQIRYSRSSTFKSSKKVTVNGYKSASKKIKKLKGKKVYYFQIRTYMTVYGEKYYSPWSPAKSVKVKK